MFRKGEKPVSLGAARLAASSKGSGHNCNLLLANREAHLTPVKVQKGLRENFLYQVPG
jgi:hypothetical protein